MSAAEFETMLGLAVLVLPTAGAVLAALFGGAR